MATAEHLHLSAGWLIFIQHKQGWLKSKWVPAFASNCYILQPISSLKLHTFFWFADQRGSRRTHFVANVLINLPCKDIIRLLHKNWLSCLLPAGRRCTPHCSNAVYTAQIKHCTSICACKWGTHCKALCRTSLRLNKVLYICGPFAITVCNCNMTFMTQTAIKSSHFTTEYYTIVTFMYRTVTMHYQIIVIQLSLDFESLIIHCRK